MIIEKAFDKWNEKWPDEIICHFKLYDIDGYNSLIIFQDKDGSKVRLSGNKIINKLLAIDDCYVFEVKYRVGITKIIYNTTLDKKMI